MNDSKKISVLIVDDSPFGRMVLANALDERVVVCGQADRLSAALEVYEEQRPDLVTMDIAMPEVDGITATRRLVERYPDAAVVIVSSMKDEELERDAKDAGAKGFFQKPFESGELLDALWKIAASRATLSAFERAYPLAFAEALEKNLTLLGGGVAARRMLAAEQVLTSQGVAVVLGVTGHYLGRLVVDFAPETAEALAAAALKRPPAGEDEVHQVAMEFVNLVGGHAVSRLNRADKSWGLRVALPGLFFGANFEMASPNLPNTWYGFASGLGEIRLGLGFRLKEE